MKKTIISLLFSIISFSLIAQTSTFIQNAKSHLLQLDSLDLIAEKLESALEQTPDNQSLRLLTAEVYEQLATEKLKKDGNEAEAFKYAQMLLKHCEKIDTKNADPLEGLFIQGKMLEHLGQLAWIKQRNIDLALGYFDQAIAIYQKLLIKYPNSAEVYYATGAGYYSKMALWMNSLNQYVIGCGKPTIEMRQNADAMLQQTFPYFQKAEMLNPNHLNTLIGLKEIFARKNDFETAGEMKKRITTIQAGGTIEKSYFAAISE